MRTASRWFIVISLLCLALGNGCRTRGAYGGSSASMPPIDVPATERIEDGVAIAAADFSTNATDRLMVYDATIHVVVEDVASTLDRLQAMATGAKGYMQEKTENSISLRIPAGQFNNAIRQVETLGEVVSQEIKGSDVTEEMKDLDIRLKNLEEMRTRLLKLADKGDKVEDLLKVEKELERVTESLELLKGRVQYLQHAVAYSTLKVFLNSPAPQKELQNIVPFAWVRDLGSDVILSTAANFVPERHFIPWLHHLFAWLKMELPASYLKVFETKGITRAMSGDGVMILIQREKNFEEGTLAFWTQTIHRWIAAGKVFAITDEKDITLDTGVPGRLLSAVKTMGHDKYQYLLTTVVTDDYVYTFECWGPVDQVAKDRESLEKAARSMRIKP